MSTLTFPTLSHRSLISCEFNLITNTQTFTSPLTKSSQTSELPGAFWIATLAFQNLSEADGRILKAFVAEMDGMAGRVYLWDMSHRVPSGIIGGTPLVYGDSQVGKVLNTDGWGSSRTGILLRGDLFGVNGELKIMTVDANSNSSGVSSLNFRPALRSTPTDNLAIITTAPTCIMRLADDQQMRQFVMKENRKFSPILNFVEYF